MAPRSPRRFALRPTLVAVAWLGVLALPAFAHPVLSVIGSPGLAFASQNATTDPYGLCPSAGTSFLGVQWNCVAELNLTVVLLMLAGAGIIAYVFRESDAAELPGDSAEIPLTEPEWLEEQARRKARLDEARASDAGAEDRR